MRVIPELRAAGLALFGALALIVASPALAGEWPQYRGPKGDGIVVDGKMPPTWPTDGLKVAWRVPLGGGYSGISAVQGKLFTQFSTDSDEFLVSFDAKTGQERWRFRLDAMRRDQFGDGPRATPTVDGQLVFAVSALGKLHAVDREQGKSVWSHDLQKEFGLSVPTWGVSSSPLVVGSLVLHNVGGKSGHALMAFDKTSGKVAWHADSGPAGYALPLPVTVGDLSMVVFFAGQKVVAVDAKTGNKFWEMPWETAYDVNAATPVFVAPDQLFISSGYDTGAALLRLKTAGGKASYEEVWRTRGMKNQFSSSIYRDGYLYGFDNKSLKCIDAKTGLDVWRKSGFGHGSLLWVDGHLVVLGENGRMALVEANPAAYTEKSSMQVAEAKHWTVPTYYDGCLYVRNEKELICYRLS